MLDSELKSINIASGLTNSSGVQGKIAFHCHSVCLPYRCVNYLPLKCQRLDSFLILSFVVFRLQQFCIHHKKIMLFLPHLSGCAQKV